MEVYEKAEKFFVENFNMDEIFNSVDRTDYLFLYYIKYLSEQSESKEKVFLTELAEKMQLSISSVSKAVKRLHEQAYVEWKMTMEKDRTYVELTESAIELMNDERNRMGKIYGLIQDEIPESDLKTTVKTMKKITNLVKSYGGNI